MFPIIISFYFEKVLVDDGCGTSGAKKRRLMIGLHSNVMLLLLVVVIVVVQGYLITSRTGRTMVNGGSTVALLMLLRASIIHPGSHVTIFTLIDLSFQSKHLRGLVTPATLTRA